MSENSGDSGDLSTKRTRRFTAKSRRGCKTCKFRRVKCDEGRPGCQRCLRLGLGICGGYRDRVPATSADGIEWLKNRPLRPAPLQGSYIGLRFEDEEEHRYFQLFRNQVAPSLGGAFESSLWNYLLPQACATELFVLDSVIAIGALVRAISIREENSHRLQSVGEHLTSTNNESYTKAYEYSLRRYNKAIQSMKIALSDRVPEVRKALMACLLVFCFETRIGNQRSALLHAQSGITLLHQCQSKKTASQMRAGSALCTVEDDIVQAIGRLDLQILVILDLRPLEFHQELKRDLGAALTSMPKAFKTVKEAKEWCELIMRQNYHFRAECSSVGNSQNFDMQPVPMPWEESLEFPMRTNLLHVPEKVPVSLLSEYQAYMFQWSHWSMAFRPLYLSLRASRHKDWIGATIILAQAKMSSLSLASGFSTLETFYDDFLVEFQEIMRLIFIVHETMDVNLGGRTSFHFDGEIIPPLFFVAIKCRDRRVRRQALQLLSSPPWREGVFDTACCEQMAKWIISLEEEGLQEEDIIPEHRRFRVRKSNIDLPKRRAQLRGTQFKAATDIEPEWKEAILTW